MRFAQFIAITALALMCALIPAHAEKRVALVVGNSTYTTADLSLSNPLNDGQDMTNALKDLGFEVVTAIDATKRKMEIALQQFARLASNADSALFFYAGHAMQYQGRNYLMPTDAELQDEVSIGYEMVSLDYVRDALDRTKGVRIIILDACRNNPLVTRLQKVADRSAGLTRGLAPVIKTEGIAVAFATAAEEVAQDGTGRNSPFTTALLKQLQEPGVEIGILFRRIADDVNSQTNGRQRPETQISLLSEYYLNQNDRHAWEHVKDQDDEAALREFLMKYALSPLADAARKRLDRLEEARRVREEDKHRIVEAEERLAQEQKRLELLKQRQQLDEQKRQEALLQQRKEQKRLEALHQQVDEEKRLEALRKQQEEEKRLEAMRQQVDEERRLEAMRQQVDEERRLEALRKQQEEEKRLAVLRKQQEEEKRLAALRKQQEEEKPQDALRRQIEELKRQEVLRQEEQRQKEALQRQDGQSQKPQGQAGPFTTASLVVNLPYQIRLAQDELRRLGCLNSASDSQSLDDATRNAVRTLWQRTNKPTTVEVNITDDFINDLKRQRDNICVPVVPKPRSRR